MLDFADEPYHYFPPNRNNLLAWFFRLYNRVRHLPKVLRIAAVQTSGGEDLSARVRDGARLVLLPNHPTHADAAIFVEACRQVGVTPQIMAAYDVFLRGRLDAFIMQRIGSFSVDREGSDARAMKQAMDTLAQGRYALTIFPEGNVYLENDRVTPFHDGAAFLALKATRDAVDRPILAVPVSIKATHLTDVRPQLADQLRHFSEALEAPIEPGDTALAALRRIGIAALHRNLRHRGIDAPEADDLPKLIEHAAGLVLDPLGQKLDLKDRPGDSVIERVRKVRRMIHEVRTDPDRQIDQAAATTWADEAMLAFRIASYSGRYVAAGPTIDRLAETIEKLSEDLHSRIIQPAAERHAFVRFNPPIDLAPYMQDGKKLRAAVRQLTSDCETAVQKGVDELNAQNPHPGAQTWDEPL